MLLLIKHLLIVNFVKMIQVDLVFIADHIMDKTVTLLNMLWNRWCHIFYLRLVIILKVWHSHEQVLDFFIFLYCRVHSGFVRDICLSEKDPFALHKSHWLLTHAVEHAMWIVCCSIEALINRWMVLSGYFGLSNLSLERTCTRMWLFLIIVIIHFGASASVVSV